MSDHYDRYNGMEELLGTNLTEVGTGLISRQEAIDAVKRLSLGETDAVRLAMRIGYYLERLQSAQPKRGKWIDRGEHESGGRHWHEWECNKCHHYFDERTFFCPHCGSGMRGEQYE